MLDGSYHGALVNGWRAVLPDTASLGSDGLTVGRCEVASLAEQHGTPLYIYDEATLRGQARRVRRAFGPATRCSFAAKACATLGVLRVFQQEGLGLDVVSLGEMEAGRRAGFQPDQIHLHGNGKDDIELEAAIREGLHAVVVDNREEIERLERLCPSNSVVDVMLRTALPLEAETHPHLQTSGRRAKFGVFRGSPEEVEVLRLLGASHALRLVGIHTHLGSQIADRGVYAVAARELVAMAGDLRWAGFPIQEISVGGGWAVPYQPGDLGLAAEVVAAELKPILGGTDLRLAVEPGRALVARAGLAIYRVRSVKHVGRLRIVAVNGGMGDNPRPALYGARYAALRVRGPLANPSGPADIVGRYCEAGDVLARDVPLPPVSAGDLICIPVAGAYQISMASGYNLVPQPAVIMVANGRSQPLTRRATIDDLLGREILDADDHPASTE